jgi:hypothetical protein
LIEVAAGGACAAMWTAIDRAMVLVPVDATLSLLRGQSVR